jgi:hypothetical protein
VKLPTTSKSPPPAREASIENQSEDTTMRGREKEIHRALDGHGEKREHHEDKKEHTHSVKYERADNGGLHAHVERKHEDGTTHHEHHVLMSAEDAGDHLQEHMGDQPDAGQMPEEQPDPEQGSPQAAQQSAAGMPPAAG